MDRSIVEYFSSHAGYKCGYCRSPNSSYSHGLWAHMLEPLMYQHLIDRGWRRSGKYCYKPTLNVTCCPLYTIRCEAKKVVLTRSQKKVLKKVHKFLAYGEKSKDGASVGEVDMDVSHCSQEVDIQSLQKLKKMKSINPSDVIDNKCDTSSDCQSSMIQSDNSDPSSSVHLPVKMPSQPEASSVITAPNRVANSTSDSTRSPCRKAKDIRRERKLQKLLKNGMTTDEAQTLMKKKCAAEPKTIEDFINEPMPAEPAHKLELRLVPVDSSVFRQTFKESYLVYKKYQMAIHQDPPDKCSEKQFTRFLANNPFESPTSSSRQVSYGSYHQHYLLDGKIIAVGVIDILPYCVSSVYFFYDPDYSFLSLGTYAALREIMLVRELSKQLCDLQYYYLGFYIHSCIKMKYKGQFVPSFLLCPETYFFQPIEKCKPKLELSKYHRLEEDPLKEDTDGVVDLPEVLILYKKTKMKYPYYQMMLGNSSDEQTVKEYAGFVGKKCYTHMMLYRDDVDE